MHHIITVQQHNKEQTFQLTQVESHYFLLIIALKVIAQISKPTHFHTLRQMQAPSFMCLLRYWPLSDVCEVSGLNIFTLWPAGVCLVSTEPLTLISRQGIPAGLPQFESHDKCVYMVKCVCLCVPLPPGQTERGGC